MGSQQNKIGSASRLILLCLAFFTLLRVAFYLAFSHNAATFTSSEALHSFFIGLRFDLRISLLLTLPLFFCRWTFSLPQILDRLWPKLKGAKTLQRSEAGQVRAYQKCYRFLSLFYTILFIPIVLSYFGDFGYFAYLQSRINYRIFEFANDLALSTQMVLQSYNVPAWGAGLLALIISFYFIFSRWVFVPTPFHQSQNRLKRISLRLTLFFLFALGIHGKIEQYPLRWSDAFFSQNTFLAQLAMNPIHYIFDTAKNSKRDYDKKQVAKYYDTVAKYLGVKKLDSNSLNFKRDVLPTPQENMKGIQILPKKPNVILIVMESMAAYKTGAFGNPAGGSPELDKLANQGWLFENYYVPTEGTARSLFCILSGVPDVNAKSTSSRNPLIVDQNTPLNAFQNYLKYYFIGGSATWGNIRGVYMNNVKDLEMFEEDKLEGPRTDVWGLSDLDLFKESARVLKERAKTSNDKPFFALIQTAGFHRPYTIPENHDDFQFAKLSQTDLEKLGFNSNEEFNSFRFSDYSLGQFFKMVENEPFFQNTVFIIQGDHGLPHDGAAHLSAGYKHFNLNRFHTPLVLYSKLIQTPKRLANIMTEPDLWPTVLGLLDLPFINTGLGRNILSPDHSHNSFAFSYVYYSDPLQIMLYDDRYLAFGTENGVESLHDYGGETPELNLKESMPEKYSKMSELLMGLFETSRYLLYHNKKLK